MKNNKPMDIQILEGIIDKAIEKNLLFELLFTEQGKQLIGNIPQKTVKEIIRKKIKQRA
ncbi:MAG: hypothetical protein N2323_07735 [candidate division WOR-3 bacterium]|nr:hypothetical protein [candidate division WOR-3 bacterium]